MHNTAVQYRDTELVLPNKSLKGDLKDTKCHWRSVATWKCRTGECNNPHCIESTEDNTDEMKKMTFLVSSVATWKWSTSACKNLYCIERTGDNADEMKKLKGLNQEQASQDWSAPSCSR